MLMAYPKGDGYFQQDNAPFHGARIVQDWFQEPKGNFSFLRWPRQSQGLSPTEHLQDENESIVRHLDPQQSNITQVETVLFIRHGVGILQITFQYLV